MDELDYENVKLGKYQRKISKLFRSMRAVEDDPHMSAAAKKSNMDAMQRDVNELYKDAVEEVRAAKSNR